LRHSQVGDRVFVCKCFAPTFDATPGILDDKDWRTCFGNPPLKQPHKQEPVRLTPADPAYPFPPRAGLPQPAVVNILGQPAVLSRPRLGLICSRQCPGAVILRTLDYAMEIRGRDLTVVSGFQSPLEAACLKILLGGTCGLVICPARSLDGMRIPKEHRAPLDAGRLALLSTFPATICRADRHTAAERNRLIAHLCDEMIMPYASPGGSVEALVNELEAAGRAITRP
jgi:predicted Rossmann fold nucleotide-binding protein DprA/Smf involved in DNA uptake